MTYGFDEGMDIRAVEVERAGLADPDGMIRARCEFCGATHEIAPNSLS